MHSLYFIFPGRSWSLYSSDCCPRAIRRITFTGIFILSFFLFNKRLFCIGAALGTTNNTLFFLIRIKKGTYFNCYNIVDIQLRVSYGLQLQAKTMRLPERVDTIFEVLYFFVHSNKAVLVAVENNKSLSKSGQVNQVSF